VILRRAIVLALSAVVLITASPLSTASTQPLQSAARFMSAAEGAGAAERTVIMGRNMTDRVIPYAEKTGADFYKGMSGPPFFGPTSLRVSAHLRGVVG
jgi:hypothetical protein